MDEVTLTIANSDDRKTSNVPPVEGEMEDVESPSERNRKKLVKFGLLLALVLIIVYVVLDYTVRGLTRPTFPPVTGGASTLCHNI